MRTALFASTLSCCAIAAGTARAQDEAPEAEPPASETAPAAEQPPAEPEPAGGKVDVRTEAPPPPVARSYHVHDGFYLRVSLGFGGLSTKYDLPLGDGTSSGGTLALDLMIGGSPSPGIAIGGAALSEAGLSHKLKVDDREVGEGNVRAGLLGPFVDGFFDPKGGWHAGGALGFASLAVEGVRGGDETETLSGFGGAAWVGYDGWVADEWSIGGLMRLGASLTQKSDDAGDLKAQTFSVQLMFTALYH